MERSKGDEKLWVAFNNTRFGNLTVQHFSDEFQRESKHHPWKCIRTGREAAEEFCRTQTHWIKNAVIISRPGITEATQALNYAKVELHMTAVPSLPGLTEKVKG